MANEVEIRMEALHQMMSVEGWAVLQEYLTRIREGDMISLSAAKRDLPDDFYRGRISAMTWLLDALPNEVREFFQEKQTQEELGQPEQNLGHPYGPEKEGQPFVEGEDYR